jgi:hypothetical protein
MTAKEFLKQKQYKVVNKGEPEFISVIAVIKLLKEYANQEVINKLNKLIENLEKEYMPDWKIPKHKIVSDGGISGSWKEILRKHENNAQFGFEKFERDFILKVMQDHTTEVLTELEKEIEGMKYWGALGQKELVYNSVLNQVLTKINKLK